MNDITTKPGVVHTKSDAEFNDELHAHLIKKTDQLKPREVQLAEAVKDARKYLDESVNTFRKDWLDWIDESKKALEDMRQFKMAIGSEARQIQATVKDLKATLDSNRDAFTQSKEVVDCLERLQKLESSGFLSRMNDTLLKLL